MSLNRPQLLSHRRRRFVEEYVVDFNGAQAAIRAGYAMSCAKVTASRLLTDDNIAAAISEQQMRLARRVEVTADRVLAELAALAFANMGDFVEITEGGTTQLRSDALRHRTLAAAISQLDITTNDKGETRTRIKLANKQAALVELAQRLNLFDRPPNPVEEDTEPVDTRKLAMAILNILIGAKEEAEAAGEPFEIEYLPGA